ncbi:MAG TPA: hypothetical protein VIW28_08835 [Gemmatimonadales bacterium]
MAQIERGDGGAEAFGRGNDDAVDEAEREGAMGAVDLASTSQVALVPPRDGPASVGQVGEEGGLALASRGPCDAPLPSPDHCVPHHFPLL